MKKFIAALAFVLSPSLFAESLQIEAGFSGTETKIESKAGNLKSTTKTKGGAFSLGLNIPVTTDFYLDSSIGYGEGGTNKSTKYVDRVLKVLPRFTVYNWGKDETVYLTAGAAAHQLLKNGEDFGVYSGVFGLGFKHEGPSGTGFGLGATYEQSFSADSYKVKGIEVKDVGLSGFEYSANFHYSL